MPYEVKVNNIEKRTEEGKDGKYTYTVLSIDYNGSLGEKKIFPSTFKKYPNLIEELKNVKAGMTIGIETSPNGKFKEISQIIVKNQTHTSIKGENYRSDDSIGAQVGNALTNACATLGGKATIAQIETRAWEIILLGNRLKNKIMKGDHIRENEHPENDPSMDDCPHMIGNNFDEEDIMF